MAREASAREGMHTRKSAPRYEVSVEKEQFEEPENETNTAFEGGTGIMLKPWKGTRRKRKEKKRIEEEEEEGVRGTG